MSNTSWLIVALLIVAIAIGTYVWTLSARRRNLARRLNELHHDRPEE